MRRLPRAHLLIRVPRKHYFKPQLKFNLFSSVDSALNILQVHLILDNFYIKNVEPEQKIFTESKHAMILQIFHFYFETHNSRSN